MSGTPILMLGERSPIFQTLSPYSTQGAYIQVILLSSVSIEPSIGLHMSRSVRFRVQSAPLSVVYRLATALVSCLNPHFPDIHAPLPRHPRPSIRVHPLPFPCKPLSNTDTTLILPPLQAHSPPSPSRAPVKPPQPVSCQRPTPIPTSALFAGAAPLRDGPPSPPPRHTSR